MFTKTGLVNLRQDNLINKNLIVKKIIHEDYSLRSSFSLKGRKNLKQIPYQAR